MFYMYIDESGNLGSQSKHLILSALLVKDPHPLDRIIKNMRRNKFKKELSKTKEIKANSSSPGVIKYIIKELNRLPEARVFYITLNKEKCYSSFLNGDRNKLYNYAAGWLAKNIVLNDCDVCIRIDKSKTKQLLRDDFDKYFEMKLRDDCSLGKVEIYHSDSCIWSGLQFADVLAWAAFQKIERGNDEFLSKLTIETQFYEVWNPKEKDGQYQ
jgi:hypothetical protein